MKHLFCDCKTDKEKTNFFLSGRAVETGIVASAISNDVAMAYHRCAEFQKEIDALRAKIEQMEIGKREISEARDGLQAEVGKLKDIEVARCVKINRYIVDNARLVEEVERLRAKIERMERQAPVAWQTRTKLAWNDGTWGPWRKCSKEYAEDVKKTPSLHAWLYEARALYALQGAKGEEK